MTDQKLEDVLPDIVHIDRREQTVVLSVEVFAEVEFDVENKSEIVENAGQVLQIIASRLQSVSDEIYKHLHQAARD